MVCFGVEYDVVGVVENYVGDVGGFGLCWLWVVYYGIYYVGDDYWFVCVVVFFDGGFLEYEYFFCWYINFEVFLREDDVVCFF